MNNTLDTIEKAIKVVDKAKYSHICLAPVPMQAVIDEHNQLIADLQALRDALAGGDVGAIWPAFQDQIPELLWRRDYPEGGSRYRTYEATPEHDKELYRAELREMLKAAPSMLPNGGEG